MNEEIAITRASHELTLKFINEADVPTRFKSLNKGKTSKYDPNSTIERNFQKELSDWKETINSILKNAESNEQAWRFIRLSPIVEPNLQSAVNCKDFLSFLEILIHRRDIDDCSSGELGKLCMLHGAFQKEIENAIVS